MRLLLDTHAFLWLANGDNKLSPIARAALENTENDRYLSTASIWEIAVKRSLNKLTSSMSLEKLIEIQLLKKQIKIAAIHPHNCITVSQLPFHHRDPFDRMIVAQCIDDDMVLISADSKLDNYEIERIW